MWQFHHDVKRWPKKHSYCVRIFLLNWNWPQRSFVLGAVTVQTTFNNLSNLLLVVAKPLLDAWDGRNWHGAGGELGYLLHSLGLALHF